MRHQDRLHLLDFTNSRLLYVTCKKIVRRVVFLFLRFSEKSGENCCNPCLVCHDFRTSLYENCGGNEQNETLLGVIEK